MPAGPSLIFQALQASRVMENSFQAGHKQRAMAARLLAIVKLTSICMLTMLNHLVLRYFYGADRIWPR
jgi:hypothetical protein